MKLNNVRLLAVFVLLLAVVDGTAYSIDNTCRSCERRLLDSLNVHNRRPIRINQVGYRPQDAKSAFVANPSSTTFRVISSESGQEVHSGSLQFLGTQPRPGIWVNGAFNSITSVYEFGDSAASASTEALYRATFTTLVQPGRYYLVVGSDTSAVFRIDETIYNKVFETALMFFGVNRCGDTHSHIHGPCHLLDGSGISKPGALQGGWHDCGDHFKVGETIGYTAFVLSLTYALFPEKSEDFYGRSYADTLPFGNDGIPDLLWETKVGADYIYRLYKASKEDGLIAAADMYHSVGVDQVDHEFWDRPEYQDIQPASKGGAPRVVATGVGANVSGMYAATLAFFAWGWAPFDPVYADSLKDAAIDIYHSVVMRKLGQGTALPGFYTGLGRLDDDPAAAALALWFLTKDERYRFDLLENTAIHDNRVTSQYDNAFFAAGHLGNTSGFHHGGWTTDYQQIHAFVLYALGKLILPNEARAAEYGIGPARRDSLMARVVTNLRKSIDNGSNGATTIPTVGNYGIHVDQPYGGVFTSVTWGYNRYNLGMVNELFMMWDLTRESIYFDIGLANMDYNLGMNPWDLSFVMGVGDKNLQHPHNRAANPDGYNAGGFPYEYTCPRGALMGGARPNSVLKDDWGDYTVTETCIDFSAQLVLPAMMLAKDLPPDFEGPRFTDVIIHQVSNTGAVVGWKTNELSVDTLLISLTPGGEIIGRYPAGSLSMEKGVIIEGLSPNTPYYFMLVGMDIRRNVSQDDNNGQWYTFTTTSTPPPAAQTTGVRVCNVRHDQATVYWWTPNGSYTSAVEFGTTPALGIMVNRDDSGLPGLFHSVTLTNLQPLTTYYFDVISGTTRDNNNGAHYQFTTTEVLADIDVLIKPIFAGGRMKYFIDVTNNSTMPYQGLELRYYFQALDAAGYEPQLGYSQMRDGGGMVSGADVTIGRPVQLAPGSEYWYLPITINSNLTVSGAARIQVEMLKSNWVAIPMDDFRDDWSVRPHTEPVPTPGIDLDKAPLYAGSEFVEVINGVTEVTYTRTKYVTAYYRNVHISGYPPDYENNTPQSHREVFLRFDSPFASPATFTEQDSARALFSGRAWARPDARLSHIEVDAVSIPLTAIPNRLDSVAFQREQVLQYGSNPSTWVAWHNRDAADCACAVVRANVEFDSLVVPRERRQFVFDPPAVSVFAEKRTQVTVRLVDTLGVLRTGEDVTLDLRPSTLGITAWISATATVPITSITLNGGSATFFVGGDLPLTGNLTLIPANPRGEFQYIPGLLPVVIEEKPPWPIIESARMLDSDCDGVPDLLDMVLTAEFLPGQQPLRVLIEYHGDTLTVPAAAATVSGRAMQVPFTSPRALRDAAPQGFATLVVLADGQERSHREAVGDGIGPAVVSVSILERIEASQATDTLYVQFDEAITAPGNTWFFAVTDSVGTSLPLTPTVVFTALSDPARNTWIFVLDNSDPAQAISAGMRLQLLPSNPLVDMQGNGASSCAQPWLNVLLRRRPVPLQYASIADSSGDGVADQVLLRFVRAVSVDHAPDSVTVIFGTAPPETLGTRILDWNPERTEAVLRLAQPFRLGNTHGPYSTIVEGREWRGAGLVIQHKGTGAQYESTESYAEDKVGPVVLEATYSQSTIFDSLQVVYSEPVEESVDSARSVLLRERGNQGFRGDLRRTQPPGSDMLFLYSQATEGHVTEGDRVRLPPMLSSLSDASGNAPSIDNPWVIVRGRGEVNIEVSVRPRQPVTRVQISRTEGYGNIPPLPEEMYRMYVVDPISGLLWLYGPDGVRSEPVDTASVAHLGPTFDIDLNIPRGAAFHEAPAWDSVQISVQGLFYSNLGAFVNRTSNNLVLRDGRLLNRDGKVQIRLEWLVHPGRGPISESGRSVGSGAYVARWEIGGSLHKRPQLGDDPMLALRFNKSFSNSRLQSFGYIRE